MPNYNQSALRNLLKRYGHINWALMDQAMVSAVNFLTGIMLARFLGIREFGIYSLAWMSVLVLNSIQYALVVAPMMSYGPKQSESERRGYFGAIFAQQFLTSLISFALILSGVFIYSYYMSEDYIAVLALPLSATCLAYQLQEFLRRYCFTNKLYLDAFITDFISYMGQLVLLILLFLSGNGSIVMALWVVCITSAVGALVIGIKRMGDFRLVSIAKITGSFKQQWDFAKWLVASALMQWTSGNFYTIMIAVYLGPVAAGALRSCQNIMGVLNILFFGLESVVPAHAAKTLHDKGVEPMTNYISKIIKYGGFLTAGFAILVACFPHFILSTAYGAEFAEYGFVLRWLALAYFFFFFATPLRSALRALEKTEYIFWGYLIATIFTFLSVFPLINYLGLTGAVIGILGVSIIQTGYLFISFRKEIKPATT